MPTLAPKLPWTHPFAGGYPRLGGQPLPTDPDAIDYLERVAAADGAAVEVGVAMAVDDFIRGMKADGIWDAIKAACIMCGARTISGALVPLKGTAPTPYNFVAADYDRSGGGLKGDGSTKYLDTNRANNADGQEDHHLAAYKTLAGDAADRAYAGSLDSASLGKYTIIGEGGAYTRSGSLVASWNATPYAGLLAVARTAGSNVNYFGPSGEGSASAGASTPDGNTNTYVFARSGSSGVATGFSDARLAFYSIGSSLDLAALDARVSTLVSAIAAAI